MILNSLLIQISNPFRFEMIILFVRKLNNIRGTSLWKVKKKNYGEIQ
jgi:hypothetical protein